MEGENEKRRGRFTNRENAGQRSRYLRCDQLPRTGCSLGKDIKCSNFPSSRVQTRPKPSDFSDVKILSIPCFGGEVNLSHVPTLGHVKEPTSCGSLRAAGKFRLFNFLPSLIESLSRRMVRSASGDEGRNYSDLGHKGPVYKA
jgi:hypothetical protein